MRKKFLVGAVFLAISTMFAGANISSVSAESVESDTKVKTITYKEIVVGVGSDTSKETFSDEFATYGLGYGKVTENTATVKKYETVTPSESNSFLFVDAGQTVSTDDWQIFTNQNNGAIMYITAKQELKLTAVNNDLGGWTDDATFSYYLRETDNTLTTLFTKVGVKGTDVGIEVYMDAGDTFYMEYIFEWGQRNLQSPPNFTLSVAAYETNTAKETALADLETAFASYKEADYSAENWRLLYEIFQKAKSAINAAETSKSVADIAKQAENDMAAVKTLAEEAEGELKTYKETKTEELKTYVAGLDKTDYTEENWMQIDEIVKNFEMGLSGLKNREEVTEAFNQAKSAIDNVEIFSPVSDTFDMDSMVKYAVTKKLSGAVDYGNVQVQLLGGTIDEPAEYDNFIITEGADGNNQYLLSKAGMDAFDSCDSAFMPWRVKYNSASWAIIKITADVDTKLIVSHDAFNGGWVQGGAFIAGYIKGINRLGTVQTVQFYHEYLTSATGEENQFGFVVQLAQGDEFYFVVGNEYMTGVNVEGNLNIIPKFEVKTEEYSSDDRNAVFDEANALEIAKERAREELNEEFSKYIKEEYSIERWAEIEYIRDGALDDIAAAETEDLLDGIVEKAKEEMAAIPDLEKEEAELSAHKNEKLQELKDYVASLGEKNYSKENWEKIQGIVADFEKAIADMDDTNKISKEFNNAKRDIDAVETKKGCGSVLLLPLPFVAITMTVAGICLINKKRKV